MATKKLSSRAIDFIDEFVRSEEAPAVTVITNISTDYTAKSTLPIWEQPDSGEEFDFPTLIDAFRGLRDEVFRRAHVIESLVEKYPSLYNNDVMEIATRWYSIADRVERGWARHDLQSLLMTQVAFDYPVPGISYDGGSFSYVAADGKRKLWQGAAAIMFEPIAVQSEQIPEWLKRELYGVWGHALR